MISNTLHRNKILSQGTIAALFMAVCLTASISDAYTPPATNRVNIDFNPGWKYTQGDVSGAQATTFVDGSWASVVLPHNTQYVTPEANSAYNGISWYRKHFTVDNAYQGKKIFLQLGAAMQTADVYLNGNLVGHHDGGYMEFTIDITSAVVFGADNVVAVKINTSINANWAPGGSWVDFQFWGGLYRDALLYVTDKLHVTDAVFANKVAGGGVFVTYPTVSAGIAVVSVKTNVKNENTAPAVCTVVSELVDALGNIAQSAMSTLTIGVNADSSVSQSMSVSTPHLWNPGSPYLYTLHTTVINGTTPVDYYKTRIGIRSIQWTRDNGILINGQSFKVQGIDAHQEIFGLGNAMPKRAIYYEVKRIREAGMQFIRGAHYPHNPAFYDACDEFGILVENAMTGWQCYNATTTFDNNTHKEIQDMIRRDRNHACIAVWETQLNESLYTTAWADASNTLAHAESAYMTTCGTAAGNWSNMSNVVSTPWDVMLAASQHGIRSNTVTIEPVIIGEYGDWDYGGTSSTSRVAREGTEAALQVQVNNIYESIHNNRSCVWYSADGYWQLADYNGSLCGIIDMYRIPKPSYYFFQSQRDPALVFPNAGTGPMVYIANRWTATSGTTVKVFSNCQTVSLYVNNVLIATRSPDNDANSVNVLHPPFTFQNVTFASGVIRADGLIGTTVVATSSRRTPLAAAAVSLRAENDTLIVGGGDARLIWVDIVDANGTVVPGNTSQVSLVVSNGSIIGPSTVTMKGGQLAVWVRGNASGPVTVSASATGLQNGTATLNAVWPENITLPRDPYIRIQAELYTSASSGILIEPCGDAGGTSDVGYTVNNSYIAFDSLNFQYGAVACTLRVAADVSAGGTVELRLDNATGTLIGTATIPSTGGWQTYATVSCPVTGVTGIKRLYCVFKTTNPYVGNVNWLVFKPEPVGIIDRGRIADVKRPLLENRDGTVSITLSGAMKHSIRVFGVNGKCIRVINAPGAGRFTFGIRADDKRNALKPGTYIISVSSPVATVTRKTAVY